MSTHTINGDMLIGAATLQGGATPFRAINPATGLELEPAFGAGTVADAERACVLAEQAFDSFRNTTLEQRAAFLELAAQNILDLGPALIERAMQESGLPQARLEGERGRTVGQLRLFAKVVRDGRFLATALDSALPERTPPRPDLRLQKIGLGPVVVFGASNFPLAFSVAGGDTASALAAGCPVVVKAHGAHPGTSELVGKALQAAVACPKAYFPCCTATAAPSARPWWPIPPSRRSASPVRAKAAWRWCARRRNATNRSRSTLK